MRDGAKKIGEDRNKLPCCTPISSTSPLKIGPQYGGVPRTLPRQFPSSWVAEGGYDPVAEVFSMRLNVDGYFLNSTRPRGNLRRCATTQRKKLILVWVTSKSGALEKGEISNAASTKRVNLFSSISLASAAVRFFEHGSRQQADDRRSNRQVEISCAGGAEVYGDKVCKEDESMTTLGHLRSIF